MIYICSAIAFFIIGAIFFYCGFSNSKKADEKFKQAEAIKLERLGEQKILDEMLSSTREQIARAETDLSEKRKEKDKLFKEYNAAQRQLQQSYDEEKYETELNKARIRSSIEQYVEALNKSYDKYEQDHDLRIEALRKDEEKIQAEIEKARASLQANAEAAQRQREMEEKQHFYKLHCNNGDLRDIETLEYIKPTLRRPEVLSKLIWTTYFQKETKDLCNRVVGLNTKCGIYKITNLKTQEMYIGQSVDIATRWTDHIKHGLGIDASSTNKLYNNMQKHGVWNFTFEVLEECPRAMLNEKEKFYIELYGSNKFGLNTQSGRSE